MSNPIRTIVAGIAQPAENDPTLVAAAELARWTGARLHLVQAFTVPPVFSPPELGYMARDWALQYADRIRMGLEAAAHRLPGGQSAVGHAVPGPPAAAVLEIARERDADLVVIGAARPDRLGGWFLGTTAQRVLRGAAVPVLVIRRPLHRPLERVLLTGDLSELSAAVHEEGLATAAALFGEPAHMRSLLVLSLPLGPSVLSSEALESAALDEIETFLSARRRRPRTVEPVVRTGAPADQIVAEADEWDADLLVVGTHARGWAARLALGSVAEAALRDAPCNVLAVPPRALALTHAPAPRAAAVEPVPSTPAPSAVPA